LIIGSLRTKKPTLNPDTFLKEALGGPEVGRYYGGGRREAGGFEIAISFLTGSYDDEFMQWKWRLYDEQVKRKLWARLGVGKRVEEGDVVKGLSETTAHCVGSICITKKNHKTGSWIN
jgi:hypothetical protein